MLNSLGYAAKSLSRIRREFNRIDGFLPRATQTPHEFGGRKRPGDLQERRADKLSTDLSFDDAVETRYSGRQNRVLGNAADNSSTFLSSLIPHQTLSDAAQKGMSVITSTPIGTSGLHLVSARMGPAVGVAASSPVGLGDDILPPSFKSMQMQLGAALDSPCSSATTLQLEKRGKLIKGPESSGYLVKMVSGTIMCPDCKTELNTTLTEYHIDVENLGSKVSTYSTLLMVVCAAQIYLIVLQMRHSEPQGASARMSMLSVGSQALLDAVLCVGHLLLSVAIPSVFFYYFMWISILKLVIYSVLEMRMMIGIYRARNLQNLELNNAMALRRYLSVIHTRFFIALFVAMMIVNMFYDKPFLLVFMFYSFWIPQIALNAFQGTRQPFLPSYAAGITLTRLFIPLYVFGCPENFLTDLLGADIVSFSTCIFLVLWLGFQLVVLELQSRIGSRFFVPKRFLPVTYDYRRPLPSSRSTEMSPLRSGNGARDDIHNPGSDAVDIETGEMKECVICYNCVDADDNNYMVSYVCIQLLFFLLFFTQDFFNLQTCLHSDHALRTPISRRVFISVDGC